LPDGNESLRWTPPPPAIRFAQPASVASPSPAKPERSQDFRERDRVWSRRALLAA